MSIRFWPWHICLLRQGQSSLRRWHDAGHVRWCHVFRLSGKPHVIARKEVKVYTIDPIEVVVNSITTQHVQHLVLGSSDVQKLAGKRVLIVDDVISTGESLTALEQLVEKAGGNIVGRGAVLAEGDAAKREDIFYLEELPLFFK